MDRTFRFGLQQGMRAAEVAAGAGAIAAKRLVRPLGRFAEAGASVSAASARWAASTPPGRWGLDVALQSLGAALGALPGSRATTLDVEELREAFVATATDSGAAVVRETAALAEAAASTWLGDPARLRGELENALERMRLLAGAGDTLDVLPGEPVSRELRERARVVVDHAPDRLLAALDGGAPEGSSWAMAVLEAVREDAVNLSVFATGYPQVLAALGSRIGRLLLTDSLTLAELDAFLAGRRFEMAGR